MTTVYLGGGEFDIYFNSPDRKITITEAEAIEIAEEYVLYTDMYVKQQSLIEDLVNYIQAQKEKEQALKNMCEDILALVTQESE